MTQPKDMIVFYVTDMNVSVNFYKRLLDSSPLEQSDDFAMFALPSGLLLGLWVRHDVNPKVLTTGTEGEIILLYPQDSEIDQLYRVLQQKGINADESLVMLEFGYTFVILSPDNHRIRYLSEGKMNNN